MIVASPDKVDSSVSPAESADAEKMDTDSDSQQADKVGPTFLSFSPHAPNVRCAVVRDETHTRVSTSSL